MSADILPINPKGSPQTWRCRVRRVRLHALDNVEGMGVITPNKHPASLILAWAMEHGLEEVAIVGVDIYGKEYFASNISDGADVVWHMARATHKLMNIADNYGSPTVPRRA